VIGSVPLRRHRTDDEHENPAWPGLVDLFAFGMVVMLLLWVQALPEPPKPGGPAPDPRQVGLENLRNHFYGVIKPDDFVWDSKSFVLRLVRFHGREIFFASGRFNLEAGDADAIKAVASQLRLTLAAQPEVVVVVSGTADPTPLVSAVPPRDNIELSALRAAEVSRVLVEQGLQQKLQVVGLGETGSAIGKTVEEMREYRQVFVELKWVERVAPPPQRN
jgi:flagellar motor protein MotB